MHYIISQTLQYCSVSFFDLFIFAGKNIKFNISSFYIIITFFFVFYYEKKLRYGSELKIYLCNKSLFVIIFLV